MSMSTRSMVSMHSTLTVVSSKPVESCKSHPLSALDHAMGSHTLHVIFYYPDHHSLVGSFELDPLRESLSRVLTLYPNMTGRLTRGQNGSWEVRHNDAGVRVIKANVDTTLHQWLTSAYGSQEALLTPWDDMPHDPTTWPPFRIQINSFEGGGVAVGLSCSHMLADLTSLASFIKSWTEVQRHVPITHPPFFTTTPLPPQLPPHVPKTPCSTTPSSTARPSNNMATATFKFSNSVINQCLSQVSNTCPNATPFDILSALFWTRAAHLKPPKNQTQSLSICTDFRTLLKPPLPKGYFGNALHFSTVSVKVEDMESGGLGGVASVVHRHLAGLEEKDIWSTIEWFESQKETEGGKYREPCCMYGSELTCVCMEHMMELEGLNMYSAMFSNDEKPVHVSCHVGNVNGEGLIMVMPSEEGGCARTVMVMLPQEELDGLRKDQAILQLEPTVLLAGSGKGLVAP